MPQLYFLDLTNLIQLRLQGGGSGVQLLVFTFQIGNLPALSLDLLGLLLVLGISVVASFLVSMLTGGPSGLSLLGTFVWALLSIWLFIILVPLVWNGDVRVDGLPLFTALVGAFVGLLIRQLLRGGLGRRHSAAAS